MRISDWSSDVCSSDLFAVNLGIVGAHSAPRLGHRRRGIVGGISHHKLRAEEERGQDNADSEEAERPLDQPARFPCAEAESDAADGGVAEENVAPPDEEIMA